MDGILKDIAPVKPRKTAEIVADRLRLAIVSGDIAKGDKLPAEHEMIEKFGVGRATMREALRILETEGLIEVIRGAKGGAQVIGPSLALAAHGVGMYLQAQKTKIADVQIARQIIEPPAARMVAERGAPEAIANLKAALEEERAALNSPDFPIVAMRFHETMVQLSGNHSLSAFLMVLHQIHHGVAIALGGELDKGDVRPRVVEIHEEFIRCVETRDGNAAETLWQEYWDWIVPYTHPEEAVVDVLKNVGDGNVRL